MEQRRIWYKRSGKDMTIKDQSYQAIIKINEFHGPCRTKVYVHTHTHIDTQTHTKLPMISATLPTSPEVIHTQNAKDRVMNFRTIPFHLNVDQQTDQPYIDFLDNPEEWNTSYTLSSILLTLQRERMRRKQKTRLPFLVPCCPVDVILRSCQFPPRLCHPTRQKSLQSPKPPIKGDSQLLKDTDKFTSAGRSKVHWRIL
ncbi:Ubiquitin-conjugating enzyme E2 U [Manis javanica]|nr:Ubiquitin-conjugating enzyme E2 U [Manis javanica]